MPYKQKSNSICSCIAKLIMPNRYKKLQPKPKVQAYDLRQQIQIDEKNYFLNKNNQRDKLLCLHFDLYDTNINLSFLLFQLLYLKVVNNNNRQIFIMPNDPTIYFEMANTIKNKILSSVSPILKTYNPSKIVDIKIDEIYINP